MWSSMQAPAQSGPSLKLRAGVAANGGLEKKKATKKQKKSGEKKSGVSNGLRPAWKHARTSRSLCHLPVHYC
jgi:hypothetical protein